MMIIEKYEFFLEQYKGSNGELIIDSLSLLAEGGEWLDTLGTNPNNDH